MNIQVHQMLELGGNDERKLGIAVLVDEIKVI